MIFVVVDVAADDDDGDTRLLILFSRIWMDFWWWNCLEFLRFESIIIIVVADALCSFLLILQLVSSNDNKNDRFSLPNNSIILAHLKNLFSSDLGSKTSPNWLLRWMICFQCEMNHNCLAVELFSESLLAESIPSLLPLIYCYKLSNFFFLILFPPVVNKKCWIFDSFKIISSSSISIQCFDNSSVL